MAIKFGPSGNCSLFYEKGFKHSYEMPAWLESLGLTAYEYQCSKGCRLKPETSAKIGTAAKKANIALSIHAPYYINLSSDGEGRKKSIGYILETLHVANIMGATRIVVHSGGAAKLDRRTAMDIAKKTLRDALQEAENQGLGHIHICPEVMGKTNQLGTLDEVIEFCQMSENLIPVIDFGHLNARTFGAVKTEEDYANILDALERGLDSYRASRFHVHFSKIEYTEKGGEKKHLTFDDEIYGPDFKPLARQLYKRRLEPTIICESDSVMTRDALEMKNMYGECKYEL
jgi:deoxyribonuclease-4